MKRRRVRSLEHYEAQAHKRRKMHEGLEPRVIKPPREEIKLYTFSQLCQLRDIEEEANKKAKVKDRKWYNAVDKALEWWRSQESVELDYTQLKGY